MQIKSKIEENYHVAKFFKSFYIDFIFSQNIYSGYLEGGPTIEDNEKSIKRLIKKSKQLRPELEPFVYLGNLDENKVYPHKANIAYINDMENHMLLEELSKLPVNHAARKNPNLEIERWSITSRNLPPLMTIFNKAAVILNSEDVITNLQQASEIYKNMPEKYPKNDIEARKLLKELYN